MNFQLLWEPVTGYIASYAQGLKIDEFWNFFGAELKRAMEQVTNEQKIISDNISINVTFLNELFEKESQLRDKPDFLNYVTLLWKAMTHFSGVVEEKNRFVVELFLDYMK